MTILTATSMLQSESKKKKNAILDDGPVESSRCVPPAAQRSAYEHRHKAAIVIMTAWKQARPRLTRSRKLHARHKIYRRHNPNDRRKVFNPKPTELTLAVLITVQYPPLSIRQNMAACHGAEIIFIVWNVRSAHRVEIESNNLNDEA